MPDYDAILGPDGALARSLQGFVARPQQQLMAERIGTALTGRELLLVEAGTGTGKTFAYLTPALFSGLRILISTGTRTLQDQLYNRDLPLLAGAVGRPVRIALLKGRNNYLCRARLTGIGQQPELLRAGTDAALPRIVAWSIETRSGDLAEVPELGESHPLRAQVTSTRDNCAGSRCPEFHRCHVFDARRAALEADIVVVNHHLLMADLALKEEGFGDLLPSVDALILDEAHQLPDLAAEFFGIDVGSRQIESLVQDLRRTLTAAKVSVRAGESLAAGLEQPLRAALARFGKREARRAWQEVDAAERGCLQGLLQALDACSESLDALQSAAAQPAAPQPEQSVAQCGARARALAATLSEIIAEPAALEGARTLTSTAHGFALSLLPYDVSTRFRALTQQHPSAWIFTSATLAVGSDFSHFAHRLGLDQAATLRLESPFDYERQALLYLPPGLPEPASAAFTDAVIDAAQPLIEAAAGGAFILFTSHRALRHAAQSLQARLPANLPLLVQGEGPRELLLRRFRASGQAVLLGTASFWEGVDVQGPALRLVIIDKLPFAAPDDPIVRARVEHLKSQGASPFRDYQLPEAVLALKQGVGRLIRSEEDRGVVVICDPRLDARAYGRVFLASLPPMPVTRRLDDALRLLRRCAQERETLLGSAVPLPV